MLVCKSTIFKKIKIFLNKDVSEWRFFWTKIFLNKDFSERIFFWMLREREIERNRYLKEKTLEKGRSQTMSKRNEESRMCPSLFINQYQFIKRSCRNKKGLWAGLKVNSSFGISLISTPMVTKVGFFMSGRSYFW